MKKNLFIVVAVSLSLFVSTVNAADPATGKLPVVKLVSKACQKEIVVEKVEADVLYRCTDGNTWAVFTSDLSGKMLSLRIVLGDMTVYQWAVVNGYDKDGLPIIAEGNENGVHMNNTYELDRKAWVKFYERHLRLPPLKLQ